MKNTIKKTELLKLLECPAVADKKTIEIVQRITDLLEAFPDKTEIEEATSIKELKKQGGIFPVSSLNGPEKQSEQLELLKSIFRELKTWINRKVNEGEVYGLEAATLDTKRKKARKIRWVGFGLLVIGIISAIVFTILRCIKSELFSLVPDYIGLGDLILGAIFFVCEQVSDSRKNNAHASGNDQVQKSVEEIKIFLENQEKKEQSSPAVTLNIHENKGQAAGIVEGSMIQTKATNENASPAKKEMGDLDVNRMKDNSDTLTKSGIIINVEHNEGQVAGIIKGNQKQEQ